MSEELYDYIYDILWGPEFLFIVGDTFSGIDLIDCEYVQITNNLIHNNTQGIKCESSFNNILENNTIENNHVGINLTHSRYVWIMGWEDYGPHYYIGIIDGSNSTNNLIFHNNLDNVLNAIDNTGINNWDNGSEGNWWADYTGQDINPPFGIGDTPYQIFNPTKIAVTSDNYPYMKKNGWL
jgi:parallel beta-helix repeat protein